MSAELVETKARFAARLNVSRTHVGRLVSDGLPVTENGDVRVDAAFRWIRANVRSGPGRPIGSDDGGCGGGDLTAAKTKLLIAQAERAELELAVRRSELMRIDEARRAVRALMRVYRDGMLNAPNRHGASMAAKLGVSPAVMIGELEAFIRTALAETADSPVPFGAEAGDV